MIIEDGKFLILLSNYSTLKIVGSFHECQSQYNKSQYNPGVNKFRRSNIPLTYVFGQPDIESLHIKQCERMRAIVSPFDIDDKVQGAGLSLSAGKAGVTSA